MIISASRRTDIPAFYADWFLNRIREGRVMVRNPYNHAQIRRVDLTPEAVDAVVFWTKDPEPLMPHLTELDVRGIPYYFQFTITPYGRDLESNLRPKQALAQTLLDLSDRIGPHRVFWRYDPIILNNKWGFAQHIDQFSAMCQKLKDATNSVTISFVDQYQKRQHPLIPPPTPQQIAEISQAFATIAAEHNLPIRACCEANLAQYGIQQASCIDPQTITKIATRPLKTKKDPHQRQGCGCLSAIDIGTYNTCTHGCLYCYANHSPASTANNRAKHDPDGPFLI